VAIDARLPEAHAALGLVTWQFNGDRAAAEQALRRAIELAPAYADAHRWYAGLLAESGRAAEADAEIRRTLALDPLTPGVVADQGLFALYARRWELAIDRYRAVLAVEPRSVSAHLGMALAEAQQHRFEAALDEIAAAGAGDSGDGSALATRAVVLGMAGRSAEARAAAAELQQLAEQRHVPAYRVAVALAGAGDADAAFSWLDKACEERCPPLGAAAVDPGLDRLRGDRRLAEVLRCAGLAR
jgi:Flp pilus assembly protein TadD